MQCEIRDRGMGNENIDKRLNFLLVDNYDMAVGNLDSMDSSTKSALLGALGRTEDEAKQGVHMIQMSLAMMSSDQKNTVDQILKDMD